MRGARLALSLLVALTWLIVQVPQASAEWFADLYGGAAFSLKHDVDVVSPDVGRKVTERDVKVDTGAAFGGRGGYWFDTLPFLGLGLDVSHLNSHTGKQTVTRQVCTPSGCTTGRFQDLGGDGNATAIGFDLFLRYPLLVSPELPKGQLQPYLTAGPALFIAHSAPNGFVPSGQTDNDTTVGAEAGAGLAWQLHKNFAVFGEYRFTHSSPEFHFNDVNLGRTTTSTTNNRSQLLFGISFRY